MTPADIIKKVRRLEIRARHLVTDSVTGAYHSSFKGRGMDFEEVREYAIGDDVRTIDWNVSAKMDRPFVKVFREEREMTLILLIDVSASGVFGSVEQSKRERAAEIASVLAFSATQNNDKVGVLLYTDEVEHYIPPKKGRRHILRVIRDILFFKPNGRGTSHKTALEYLNRVQRRKTVVFMISDFLDLAPGTLLFDKLALTNQHHDLISIALSDPRESASPRPPRRGPPRPRRTSRRRGARATEARVCSRRTSPPPWGGSARARRSSSRRVGRFWQTSARSSSRARRKKARSNCGCPCTRWGPVQSAAKSVPVQIGPVWHQNRSGPKSPVRY